MDMYELLSPTVGEFLHEQNTSKKTVFYDNFVSFWTRHSKHSCHNGPFSYHIGHFLSFWTVSQKTMFLLVKYHPLDHGSGLCMESYELTKEYLPILRASEKKF